MSRLWNRARLRIFLGEDRLVACRIEAGWHPRILSRSTQVFAPGSTPATEIEKFLGKHQGEPGVRVDVILGIPHVRYFLLPWDRHLVEADFRHSVARALFARQFHEDFQQQEVRYGPLAYGRPLLAACIGKPLIVETTAVIQRHGGRIRSIQPLLASVWSQFGARLSDSGRLLISEPTRAIVVQRHNGMISDLGIRPCAPDDVSALAERLSHDAGFRLFSPMHPWLAERFPTEWLGVPEERHGKGSTADDHSYALCGVL